MKIILLIALIQCTAASKLYPESHVNTFEATYGCLQYNANNGYEYAHPYYSTANFKHLKVTPGNVTSMRMGVLARNDGHIRLAPKEYPYEGTEMNELVLSGWANTAIEIRRYTRTDPKTRTNLHVFVHSRSDGLLSEFSPMMFTMSIDQHGNVKLIKDGHQHPFVEFRDSKISFKYIGFCSFDVPAIYFFDCPFEVDRRRCDGIVLT